MPEFQIVHDNGLGFIYKSATGRLNCMRYNELNKYCDMTLKTVPDNLVHRLIDLHFKKIPSKEDRVNWNSSAKRQVRKFVHKIEERLNRRDQIRRLESYIGAKPSFLVKVFQWHDPQLTNIDEIFAQH